MSRFEINGDVYSILILVKNFGSALGRELVSALRAAHGETGREYRALFHTASSPLELRAYGDDVHVDFVIVAMDPRDSSCAAWVDEVLSQLSPALLAGRAVLLDAVGAAHDAGRGTRAAEQLDLFHGDVRDHAVSRCLAQRLLTYMEFTFGCHSGVPDPLARTYPRRAARPADDLQVSVESG